MSLYLINGIYANIMDIDLITPLIILIFRFYSCLHIPTLIYVTAGICSIYIYHWWMERIWLVRSPFRAKLTSSNMYRFIKLEYSKTWLNAVYIHSIKLDFPIWIIEIIIGINIWFLFYSWSISWSFHCHLRAWSMHNHSRINRSKVLTLIKLGNF